LNVIELKLPPLRERGNDILEIAEKLLEKTCQRLHVNILHFHEDARKAMLAYPWPGNVRELENAIERAVILAEHPEITPDLLAIDLDIPTLTKPLEAETVAVAPTIVATEAVIVPPAIVAAVEDIAVFDETIRKKPASEFDFLSFVLSLQDKLSETELAKRLGISRKSLWERRQKLGIPRRMSQNKPES
jgi:DNA-binding NtrC family response regulator